MFLFYLITLFYGSNSLPLSLLSMPSVNKTKSNDDDLLAKIKSNPQKFVSEFQNLDPADLKHIISLLEELREKSVARENELVTDLNNKNSALADANSNVITAGDALDVANQAVTDAETDLAQKNDAVTEQQGILNGKQADAAAAEADLTTKKAIHKTKQTERNVAQTAHDDEVPDLNDEQQILTDVVNMLQGLHDKHTGGAGCSSGATTSTEVAHGIYACEGSWAAAGIEAGGAALCGASTELCDYTAINQLTTEQCDGVGDKFFGTRVSSHTGWACEERDNTQETNDVWGCGTACQANAPCGILHCGLGNANFGNWVGLRGSGFGKDERLYIRHTSATGGGVMCCPKA